MDTLPVTCTVLGNTLVIQNFERIPKQTNISLTVFGVTNPKNPGQTDDWKMFTYDYYGRMLDRKVGIKGFTHTGRLI